MKNHVLLYSESHFVQKYCSFPSSRTCKFSTANTRVRHSTPIGNHLFHSHPPNCHTHNQFPCTPISLILHLGIFKTATHKNFYILTVSLIWATSPACWNLFYFSTKWNVWGLFKQNLSGDFSARRSVVPTDTEAAFPLHISWWILWQETLWAAAKSQPSCFVHPKTMTI